MYIQPIIHTFYATSGIVAAIFMLIAGVFFRKIHNRRAIAQALKIASMKKDIEANGGEFSLTYKKAVLTSREMKHIDGKIDDKTMAAMFETLKSVTQLAKDQQDTNTYLQNIVMCQQDTLMRLQNREDGVDVELSDQIPSKSGPKERIPSPYPYRSKRQITIQKRSDKKNAVQFPTKISNPTNSSGNKVSSLIELQVNFKKLSEIVEFDFNESHLSILSSESHLKSLSPKSGKGFLGVNIGDQYEEKKVIIDPIPFNY